MAPQALFKLRCVWGGGGGGGRGGAPSTEPVLGSRDNDLTALGRPGSGIDLMACWGGGGGGCQSRVLVTFKGVSWGERG